MENTISLHINAGCITAKSTDLLEVQTWFIDALRADPRVHVDWFELTALDGDSSEAQMDFKMDAGCIMVKADNIEEANLICFNALNAHSMLDVSWQESTELV